jgi:hypothetical protein
MVIHQHDDTWQFVSGNRQDETDMRVTHAGHLLERDTSLAVATTLAKGQLLVRGSAADDWQRVDFATDTELDDLLDSLP